MTDYYNGCYYNGNDENCNDSFSGNYNGYGKMDYIKDCPHDSCSSVTKDRLFCSTTHDWYSSDSNVKGAGNFKSEGCPDGQTTLPPDLYID